MNEENKDIFEKVEGTEKQLEPKNKETTSKVEELKAKREEILNDGDLDALEEVDEELDEAEEEENELKAPSLDDLDDTPQSQKYRMVTSDTEWKDGTVLTVERVRLQPPFVKDKDGNIVEPETSPNGKYYKAKLVLDFAEEVNGTKIKQSVPSIYYGVNEDGSINKVPGIPQACDDESLEDNMTSSLAKLRNKYCKFVKKSPKDVSNKEFAQGLVGKKVSLKKESGKYQGRKWAKLVVDKFV